jgi:hypothetical protein
LTVLDHGHDSVDDDRQDDELGVPTAAGDFEEAMDVHFWARLRTMLTAIR